MPPLRHFPCPPPACPDTRTTLLATLYTTSAFSCFIARSPSHSWNNKSPLRHQGGQEGRKEGSGGRRKARKAQLVVFCNLRGKYPARVVRKRWHDEGVREGNCVEGRSSLGHPPSSVHAPRSAFFSAMSKSPPCGLLDTSYSIFLTIDNITGGW